MKQLATVVFKDDVRGGVRAHGELVFDKSENSLYAYGEDGTYAQFNWDHVLYVLVSRDNEERADV